MSTPNYPLLDQLVAREALLLDTRQWDDWLGLYAEDAEFWVPAWQREGRTTKDPQVELSLMYLKGIGALKERVWRVKSGLSRASVNLHRTVHIVGSMVYEPGPENAECTVLSAAAVHVYDPSTSKQHCFFIRYRHTLRQAEGHWQIARKHVTLMNDQVPTMLDFYSI